MAEQNNNEVMIQLPWTVPQPPLYTTHVGVDPETNMIPLDIQHSTDTTAIWSFVAAMIASMVIAIWYGRKSFELTKQSFDALVKQIESSESITIQSNKDLIQSHLNLMLKTQKIEMIKNTSEKFESSSLEFLYLNEQFLFFMFTLENENRDLIFNRSVSLESYEGQLYKQIHNKIKDIYDAFTRLRFHLRSVVNKKDNPDELIEILNKVVKKSALIENELIVNRENFMDYLEEYGQEIAKADLMLNTVLKDLSILKINND